MTHQAALPIIEFGERLLQISHPGLVPRSRVMGESLVSKRAKIPSAVQRVEFEIAS